MKNTKKIVSLSLATAMVVGSSISAFALPGNTAVIGNKAFSLDYFFQATLPDEIVTAITDGGDIYFDVDNGENFIDAWTGEAITDPQKQPLTNIEYLDFDGSRSTYANFDDKTPVDNEELTVLSATAVSSTTIYVTFSNGDTQTFSGFQLVAGTNHVEFEYEGKPFSNIEVSYTSPVVSKAAVEDIKLVNYRELIVEFNTEVDPDSAKNPANYYFGIVEGNGEQRLGANNILTESLSFAEINEDISGVVITPETKNGKTVVTIHLPEDARFTYRLDLGNYYYDDEKTIIIQRANGSFVALDEDETVSIAVRNVKDKAGNYSIDTYVKTITIKELVAPNLLSGTKYMKNADGGVDTKENIAVASDEVINIDNSRDNEKTSKFTLVFDEPVFDGHKNAMNEDENAEIRSDVKVFINDRQVTETDRYSFESIIKFNMDADDSYLESRQVTLDLYEAVRKYILKTYGDLENFWNAGKTYDVKIKGITDLAGNIMTSSTINFKFKLVEPPTSGATNTYYPPVVKDVVQVADNVLRVYFDQQVTDFTFVIEGVDGDAGNITREFNNISGSVLKNANGLYYYDVFVPASDFDFNNWAEDILSYKNQDFINTNVFIKDVRNEANDSPANIGASKEFSRTLVKDIHAPIAKKVYIDDASDIKYYEDVTENAVIKIELDDVTPFAENIEPTEVYAVKYRFGYDEFTDNISLNSGDFLPITISYEDSNGIHTQVVSNQAGLVHNPGIVGAISYDDASDILTIDLNKDSNGAFVQLLNDEGRLIEGETYTISIPKGYFSDSKRLDAYLGDYDGNKLYVDNGRGIWYKDLGFASEAMTLQFKVPVRKVPVQDEYYGVPQTTKELITWDEVQNVISIEFTGDIDPVTLTNPANYLLDGIALPANTVIEYKVDNQGTINNLKDDRKFAIIKLPENTVAVDGFVRIDIMNVANPDGGKMTPVSTKVELSDNTRPRVESAVVSGQNQIILTFSEPLEYKAGQNSDTASKNFGVTINGAPCTVSNASINKSNDVTKVTLTVYGTVINQNDVVKVIIKEDINGAIYIEDRAKKQNPIVTGEFAVENPTAN